MQTTSLTPTAPTPISPRENIDTSNKKDARVEHIHKKEREEKHAQQTKHVVKNTHTRAYTNSNHSYSLDNYTCSSPLNITSDDKTSSLHPRLLALTPYPLDCHDDNYEKKATVGG